MSKRSPLGMPAPWWAVDIVLIATMWMAATTTYGIYFQSERVPWATMMSGAIGGLGIGAIITWASLQFPNRSDNDPVWAISKAIAHRRLPSEVDSSRWRTDLERRGRYLRRQRVIGPLALGSVLLIVTVLQLPGPEALWVLGVVFLLLALAIVVNTSWQLAGVKLLLAQLPG